MKARTRTITFTIAAAGIAFLLAYGGALAAKGGTQGPPDTGGEETAGNNLSYPAVLIYGNSTSPSFTVLGIEEELGETYSYGCEGEEMMDGFSYPNTSCVGADGSYLTADQCTAVGAKCYDKTVDRIYWQKEADNEWSSQITGVSSESSSAPVLVRYVDWGDSIEVVNWNETSVLRVETQPFADLGQDQLAELPPAGSPGTQTQTGFQMWHVSGQGITEQWGARVTETTDGVTGLPVRGLPYSYQSPYAIINAGTAELYLSKLFPSAADDVVRPCPATGGDEPPDYPGDYPFIGHVWEPGVGWSDACNLPSVSYTIEQSVSGKYVHGYNWRMRDLTNPLPRTLCGDDLSWEKTGWWRLTFVPNGNESKTLFTGNTVTTAPEIPVAIPMALPFLTEESEETDEGTLYTPVVDVYNNLTYIDICIVKKTKSGGKGTK